VASTANLGRAVVAVKTDLDAYAERYEFAKLERRDGILLVELHTNSEPLVWSEVVHRELSRLFYDIGADRENAVVILTGAGDRFIGDIAAGSWDGDKGEPTKMNREAKQILYSLLDIDVPVVGAVNGPVRVHSELALLSDIVLASETALFQDAAHFEHGAVPGDGVHTLFPMWLGPNRGRYFLLMGQEIDAREALSLGLVAEVLSPERLRDRAWEVAERVAARPRVVTRLTRLALTLQLKRALHEDLQEGCVLELLAIARASTEG